MVFYRKTRMSKKIFFTLGTLLLVCGGIVAYKFLKTSDGWSRAGDRTTTVELLNESVHLGTFNISAAREGLYEIKNNGPRPLIILEATTSCNCTEVEWPRRPIAPGDTARVRFTYTPNDHGRFSKTINLYCNTKPPVLVLRLDGHVE
jgi:hypothetical protein